MRNWIRKWLGLDRLDSLLGEIETLRWLKEHVKMGQRKPTWLSPYPKIEKPPYLRWQKPKEEEPPKSLPKVKFKGKYSVLNLTDEEALDKLMKIKKKPPQLTKKDKMQEIPSDTSYTRPRAHNYDIY